MLWKWLPWKLIARRIAKAHGLLDPLALLARVERFAQPSEVAAPMELIRAGISFHARGLINTKVIQQNLDWVWPYWVQRQFDPSDESFVPRAFSITHVNLTHRNWTAIGLPDCDALPIVDPRGLVTPIFDGWSIDAWILPDGGGDLLPSREPDASQKLLTDRRPWAVETQTRADGASLQSLAEVTMDDGRPVCNTNFHADAGGEGWLVVSLRPFNPEGISFIESVELTGRKTWLVDDKRHVELSEEPDRHVTSNYRHGDVFIDLIARDPSTERTCKVGLATAAAMYRIPASGKRSVSASVDLLAGEKRREIFPAGSPATWSSSLDTTARLDVPDQRFRCLYDLAVRSMILHSPDDVYPGPYTYKRFWFRDAVIILQAMLCAGMEGRVRRSIGRFLKRQHVTGYFHSQQGEWDSNGQVLWLLGRLRSLTQRPIGPDWRKPVVRAVHWIHRKRTDDGDALHAGLLPAGFSAEHLGNNDYYYWDDLWSVAGLREAAGLLEEFDEPDEADFARNEARSLNDAIDRSLVRSQSIRGRKGIPASPYRRMDAGAVGSLVAGYPLALWEPDDDRLLDAAEFLCQSCLVDDAFFQDMIHSGLNAYLTLHLAQVLLRAGDGRYLTLLQAVADLASSTGQWPEAIHPRTGGGCMGDGHHVWASAEWVMMIRHLFVREEPGRLVLVSGLPEQWLAGGQTVRFGPTPTPWGAISVSARRDGDQLRVQWDADWFGDPPTMEVAPPGMQKHTVDASAGGAKIDTNRMPVGQAGRDL